MTTNNIHPEFAAIIERYTKGHSAARDDTSNGGSDAINLANVDRFGFFHSSGMVPEKELTKDECQRLSRRLEKWRQMTSNAEEKGSNWRRLFRDGSVSDKLKRRVFKGIPQQYRLVVWPLLLKVPEIKKQHKNLYSEMLSRALATSVHLDQIDKDINRTFRNTTYFHTRYGSRQQALFRILAAYSVYNNEVGYCQGMSELVGLFLTYIIEEEDVFWALSQLMAGSKYRMHGVFSHDFPGLYRLFNHHERVIMKLLPRVAKHFTEQDLPTSTYALKWFMQCFLDRLPISLVLRLWDIYLLEGERILIAMAFNILKLHKRSLLRMYQAQLTCFFQDELVKNFRIDDDAAIESLKDCLEILHRFKLDQLPAPTPEMLPTRSLGVIAPELIWQNQPSLPSSRRSKSSDFVNGHCEPVQSHVVHAKKISPATTRFNRLPPTHSGLDTSASILTAAAMSTRTRVIHPKPSPPTGGSTRPIESIGDVRYPSNKILTVNRPEGNFLTPSQRSSSVCHVRYSPTPAGYATTDSRRRLKNRKASYRSTESDVILVSIRPRNAGGLYDTAGNRLPGSPLERTCIQSPTFSTSESSAGRLSDSCKAPLIYTSLSSNDSSGFAERITRQVSSTSSSAAHEEIWLRHPGLTVSVADPMTVSQSKISSPSESESSWMSGRRTRKPSGVSHCSKVSLSCPTPKDSTLVPQTTHSIDTSGTTSAAPTTVILISGSSEKRTLSTNHEQMNNIPRSSSFQSRTAASARSPNSSSHRILEPEALHTIPLDISQSDPVDPVFSNEVQMPPSRSLRVIHYTPTPPALHPRKPDFPKNLPF